MYFISRKKFNEFFVFAFLVVLFFSCPVGVQFVRVTAANPFRIPTPQPAIFIKSDGSVQPSARPIQQAGDVYTFTHDITGFTIAVERDNIIIDGAGYTLRGNGESTGIFIQERTNVTVRNIAITDFSNGIVLYAGVDASSSMNNISGNTITGNTAGISISYNSVRNVVSGNTIIGNDFGISIVGSSGNVLRNNQMTSNTYNLEIAEGMINAASVFVNDIDASNTVDGRPVYYWVDQNDKTVPSDAGYVALINCERITVRDLSLSHNGQGILLVSTTNSLITRNNVANNNYGIVLRGLFGPCALNTITENRINANTWDGINLVNDHDDNIAKNYITNNQGNGIYSPSKSRGNSIIGNNITANRGEGIVLVYDSGNHTISENYIANNEHGIWLDTSSNNNVVGNAIIANRAGGIMLFYTYNPPFSNNRIYHNDFANSPEVVYTAHEFLPPLPAPPVIWDNGSEGNYWNQYHGSDNNADGIGDTPYRINANFTDRFPLMKPVTVSSIAEPPEGENSTSTVPPSQQPSFLGSNLPLEYGYAIVAATLLAIVAAGGYMFSRRRKKSSTTAKTSTANIEGVTNE